VVHAGDERGRVEVFAEFGESAAAKLHDGAKGSGLVHLLLDDMQLALGDERAEVVCGVGAGSDLERLNFLHALADELE